MRADKITVIIRVITVYFVYEKTMIALVCLRCLKFKMQIQLIARERIELCMSCWHLNLLL